MTLTHLSSRRVAATIGLLAAGIALFVPLPMSANSESACEAMARWATEYERTTPAPTLDDLSTFDRAHRVAIFNAVTPEIKANLFHEQLRRFNQRPDLTSTQRALIAEGISLLTPALYRQEPTAAQAYRSFWSRAQASFNSPAQRRPWMDIGYSASANYAFSTLDKQLGVTGLEANCECNVSWQDCFGWSCLETTCNQRQGCGSGGAYTCNGNCFPVTPSASQATNRSTIQ